MNDQTLSKERMQFEIDSATVGVKIMSVCRDVQFTIGITMASSGFANCMSDNYLLGVPLIIGGGTYYLTAVWCNNVRKEEKREKKQLMSLYKHL